MKNPSERGERCVRLTVVLADVSGLASFRRGAARARTCFGSACLRARPASVEQMLPWITWCKWTVCSIVSSFNAMRSYGGVTVCRTEPAKRLMCTSEIRVGNNDYEDVGILGMPVSCRIIMQFPLLILDISSMMSRPRAGPLDTMPHGPTR